MTQLLDLKYKEEHAKVVGEIVLSTVEQYQSRVALLCQFIIKEIQEEVAGKRPQHSDRLYNFMAVFSSCIHRPPQELKSPAPYELPVGEPEINMLVACFSNMSFVQQFKNFFITLVHLPNPAFKLGIANAMDYLMVKLCSDIQEGNFVLAELLSLVAISKKVYADRILEENIVDLLFRKLPTLDGKKLVSVLLFFRNIINHEACLKKCIELKLPELIFVQMKNAQSKKQEQSPKSQSMMILGLDIIKYVISTDNSSAKLFCDSLIEQLNTLMTDNSADAAQLIETVKSLATEAFWLDRTRNDDAWTRMSNRKLLRLHGVLTAAAKRFGSRAEIIDAIAGAEGHGKDADYKKALEKHPLPRLMDHLKSAEGRVAKAAG